MYNDNFRGGKSFRNLRLSLRNDIYKIIRKKLILFKGCRLLVIFMVILLFKIYLFKLIIIINF